MWDESRDDAVEFHFIRRGRFHCTSQVILAYSNFANFSLTEFPFRLWQI